MNTRSYVPYLRNCFWFVVPVLLFNVLFARSLPPAYQASNFWRDIPRGISVPENALRVLVMSVPVLMPVAGTGAKARSVGFACYGVGLALYFASWLALILYPDSTWSTHAPGFMGPAWTPIVWLVGIALINDGTLAVPLRFFSRPLFLSGSVLFLLFHNLHVAFVFVRQR